MSITTETLEGMFKVHYQEPMFNTVVNKSQVFDLFKQSTKKMSGAEREGRYIELSHLFGEDQSIGARFEDEFLPVPGSPTFVNGRVRLKYNYMTLKTSHQSLRNAEQGPAAFASFTQGVLMPKLEAFTDDLNRQSIGYGVGILCRVDDASPDATLGVDAPYGIANNTGGSLIPGLRRGMRLVFGPNADGSGLRTGSAKILSVDHAANGGGGILTLDALPAGVADDDYIWRGDDLGNNAPAGGTEKEFMGLLGHVDDGTRLVTHQNISRTTYPEWQSTLVNLGSAPYSGSPTDIAFQRLGDDAATYGNGEVKTILTTRNIWRAFYATLRTSLPGIGSTQNGSFTVGAKGISCWIGGRLVEVRAYDRMPPGIALALDTAHFHRYGDEQGEWDRTTGSMWFRPTAGVGVTDSLMALYRFCLQTGSSDPRKSAQGYGLSETAA